MLLFIKRLMNLCYSVHACTPCQPFHLDMCLQEEAARVYSEEAYPDIVGRHLLPSHVAPATINQEVAAAARAAFEDDRSFGRGGNRVSGMDSRCGPCSGITQPAFCVLYHALAEICLRA